MSLMVSRYFIYTSTSLSLFSISLLFVIYRIPFQHFKNRPESKLYNKVSIPHKHSAVAEILCRHHLPLRRRTNATKRSTGGRLPGYRAARLPGGPQVFITHIMPAIWPKEESGSRAVSGCQPKVGGSQRSASFLYF